MNGIKGDGLVVLCRKTVVVHCTSTECPTHLHTLSSEIWACTQVVCAASTIHFAAIEKACMRFRWLSTLSCCSDRGMCLAAEKMSVECNILVITRSVPVYVGSPSCGRGDTPASAWSRK